MRENRKHCNTCRFSKRVMEKNLNGGESKTMMQHCTNPVYNAPAYTNRMLLEDWGQGYCRFWQPKPEKGMDQYEEQLFDRAAQCHRGGLPVVH